MPLVAKRRVQGQFAGPPTGVKDVVQVVLDRAGDVILLGGVRCTGSWFDSYNIVRPMNILDQSKTSARWTGSKPLHCTVINVNNLSRTKRTSPQPTA